MLQGLHLEDMMEKTVSTPRAQGQHLFPGVDPVMRTTVSLEPLTSPKA
jgi:hypothetical protein